MSANSPIRILVVDDHPLFRKGVAAILESEADMVVAAEASHGREADRIRPANSGEEDFNRAGLDSQLTHPPPTIRSFHATRPQS